MHALTASRLVALWEEAAEEHPLDRALTLIAAAEAGADRAALADLPVAERDRRLFALTAALFGDRITVFARCAACGAETELGFSAAAAAAEAAAVGGVLEFGGRAIAYRAPTSRDLAAALRAGSAGRAALLAALVDEPEPAPALIDALDAALAARAGLEVLSLRFACADCGAAAAAPFDILDYLWRRLAARAQRLLWDVHLLARAYGWTTGEILALSDRRRAAHVAMVTA